MTKSLRGSEGNRIAAVLTGVVILAQFPAPADAKKKAVQPVAVGAVSAGPVNLRTVNQRWAGSRALIRVEAEIKKGRDKQGWSASDWLLAPTLPGEKDIKFRILVSDRERLMREGYLYRKKHLRPGTSFIVEGWRLGLPEKEKELHLNLQFEKTPVDVRLEFSKNRMEDLEDVERLMRIQIFQLSAAPVAPPPAPAAPPPPTVSQGPPTLQAQTPGEQTAGGARGNSFAGPGISAGPDAFPSAMPSIKVLSASVRPAEARAGTEVGLMIVYQVEGASELEVVEERILESGGNEVARFEDRVTRAPGSATSSQPISVPANAPAGFYTFKARVSAGGASSEASAFFRVN